MTICPRVPEDAVILEAIRAGCNTGRRIAMWVYGDLPPRTMYDATRKVTGKLRRLEKQGYVKKDGVVFVKKNWVSTWAVVE